MKTFLKIGILILFVICISAPFVVLAQQGIPPGGGTTGGGTSGALTNPLKEDNIYNFLKNIVELVVQIGFYVALVGIVYSGFLFVTAQGNETKLATAKKALTYSLVGTAILMSAWVFAIAIQGAVRAIQSDTGAFVENHFYT
jgi:preprotein translocase subunit SecG